jgi:predicted transcriptional regulator
MMDLKRQRGERDIVRAYVDEQSASIANAEAHGAIREEMDELNRRVIKGDAEALARLQEIYSRIESKDQTPQGAARVLPANDAM